MDRANGLIIGLLLLLLSISHYNAGINFQWHNIAICRELPSASTMDVA